jgi:hypothetical protein
MVSKLGVVEWSQRSKNEVYVLIKMVRTTYNKFKADIFSLGLVALEMGTFSNIQSIYQDFTIRDEIITSLVERYFEYG